jgi:hypothetical protein
VSRAFDTVAANLEEKLSPEHITLRFNVNQCYVGARRSYVNVRSEVFVVAGHNLLVKLCQKRDDEPIEVGLLLATTEVSTSASLNDVDIQIVTKARVPPLLFDDEYKTNIPQRMNFNRSTRTAELKTKIPYLGMSGPTMEHGCMTVPHLEAMSTEQVGVVLTIIVSFSISKKKEKSSSVYFCSSPCSSPRREDNYSEEDSYARYDY